MLRFVVRAVPLVVLLLAVFGAAVRALDVEPVAGAVLALDFSQPRIPIPVVLGGWIFESLALVVLFLLIEGRCGARWLDGLVAGWVAWTFRGPLLVITMVTAAGQRQDPWWTLAFGWWVLYSVAGVALGILAGRLGRERAEPPPAVREPSS